jgi:di/tricarboxylate transporter
MGYEAWFAISVVVVMLGFLALTKIGPDTVLMGGVTLLLITGILSPREALSGLANEGMVTVGVLYIVAAGIHRTGLTVVIVDYLLGKPRSMLSAQLRLQVPTTVISAFTNNTPQVAIMIPAVEQWCRRHDLPVSKFMIPLSYASLLGMWTLIGTSTNLIVNGLIMSQAKAPSLGMFDIAWVGVPVSALGLLFMILCSKWLLPDRQPGISVIENTREYTVEMIVQPGGRLEGKTVEEAGLRNLPNMYLAEIERRGHALPAVSNQELLEGADRLLFVGAVDGAVDLQKIKGLMPATEQVFKLRPPRSDRSLLEAVVSHGSPLVGRSIRQGRFRARYNAVVLAVSRHGALLRSKVGDVTLVPGDTLLLEARPSFYEEHRYTRDFYLVSPIEDSSPPRHERAPVTLIILGGMVALATLEWLSMLQAAMLAAGFMIMTGCVSGSDARSSIDTEVLLTIAASIGLGQALLKTGAAEAVATGLIGFAGSNPWTTLTMVYITTLILTEVVGHAAAAVLIFPIAMSTAQSLGVNVAPFAISIMMSASLAFASPIANQTHLMVWGPGGYRFTDFLRMGIPMDIITATASILLIPMIWPF